MIAELQERADEFERARLAKESDSLLDELSARKRLRGMDYYIPNRIQYDAHRSEAHTILICTANRVGKSTFGAMELCFHLTRKYPDWYPASRRFRSPVKTAVSATSFNLVERVIEPKIFSLLPKDYYSVRRSGPYLRRIICKDGSSVDVLTLEMDDKTYESADWDIVWEDEPQDKRKREGLIRGLVDRNGYELITFTPISEPWMKDELVDKADGKRIALFTGVIRDNMFDIQGNAILNEAGIKRFEEAIGEEYRDARLKGIFFTVRGQVYRRFSRNHIINGLRYRDEDTVGDPVICVLDPHDRLPHHVIWAYIDPQDDIFVVKESSIHCELPKLADHILSVERQEGFSMRKRLIDPNFGRKPARAGSNYSVIQELAKEGTRFFEPSDDIELGHMVVRDYLYWDDSKPVTATNKPKLYFSTECPLTIKSMRNLQYQEWQGKTAGDRSPKEMEKDKENHGADCVRYLCITRPSHKGQALDWDEGSFTNPY